MSSIANPLQGWQNPGVQLPNPFGMTNPAQSQGPGAGSGANPLGLASAPQTPINQNPYGQGTRGGGNQTYNLAETNLQTGLANNALINPFAQNFFNASAPAANYFSQLMNLGSPYYQQQQRSSFEQGVQQSQNAAAQSRQQLGASGYGFTPSGANAAMLGGQAVGTAGNLSMNFLQNLFNNEQLQLAGAQGLSQLASMFNPAQLTRNQTNPQIQQPTNTAAQDLGAIGQLFGGVFGSGGV